MQVEDIVGRWPRGANTRPAQGDAGFWSHLHRRIAGGAKRAADAALNRILDAGIQQALRPLALVSAVHTTLQIFDITAYEAVGDGVADDSDALSAAGAAASAAGGGTVYIPSGSFRLASDFELYSDVQYVGSGYSSHLFVDTDIGCISGIGAEGAELKNIRIANLRISGNGGATLVDPITLNYVDDSCIEDCWIENAGRRGIHAANSERLVIRGNRFLNCGIGHTTTAGGEAVFLSSCHNSVVTHNVVVGTGRHGINFFMSRGTTVGGNVLKTIGAVGITVSGGTVALGYTGQFGSIAGNTIEACANDGIVVENEADYTTVVGNTINGAVGHGILFSDGGDGEGPRFCACKGNTVYNVAAGGAGYGIRGNDAEHLTVTGNTVDLTVLAGIRINGSESRGSVVEDNCIYRAGDSGISIFQATHVGVSDNTVDKPGNIGIDLDASTYCIVTENHVIDPDEDSSAAGDGIRVRSGSTNNIISYNQLHDTRGTPRMRDGVNLQVGAIDNRVFGNQAVGFTRSLVRNDDTDNWVKDNHVDPLASKTLSTNGTFTAGESPIHVVDTNGANRNYNPSGNFSKGYQVVIVNTGAQTLTFDSTGIAATIQTGSRGTFVYTGTSWLRVDQYGLVVYTDTITERTAAAGVRVDTLLLKDKIVGAAGEDLGFYGVGPVARPAAYTQTYATADRTHAARTASAITDNVGGSTADAILAAIPDPADTPVTADSLRDDLVANVLPKIRDAVSKLADQHNKLNTDALDTAQVVNASLDDFQSLGLQQ